MREERTTTTTTTRNNKDFVYPDTESCISRCAIVFPFYVRCFICLISSIFRDLCCIHCCCCCSLYGSTLICRFVCLRCINNENRSVKERKPTKRRIKKMNLKAKNSVCSFFRSFLSPCSVTILVTRTNIFMLFMGIQDGVSVMAAKEGPTCHN